MADMDEEAEDRVVTAVLRLVAPVLTEFGLRPPDLTTEELAELAASLLFSETADVERIALAALERNTGELQALLRAAAALETPKDS
jgi:hypothetical protein